VPSVAFIKCDMKEADLLTGNYSSCGSTVSRQLYWYCLCSTQETDDVTAKFPPKMVGMIQKLVDKNDRAPVLLKCSMPCYLVCLSIPKTPTRDSTAAEETNGLIPLIVSFTPIKVTGICPRPTAPTGWVVYRNFYPYNY
jgi:hypothetical protein